MTEKMFDTHMLSRDATGEALAGFPRSGQSGAVAMSRASGARRAVVL